MSGCRFVMSGHRRTLLTPPILAARMVWGAGVVLLATACGSGDRAEPFPWTPEEAALLHEMLVAEDARPQTREGLDPLVRGLEADHPGLRARAAVGVGRLERDSLAPLLQGLLDDPEPTVRKAAVWALGHSMRGRDTQAMAEFLISLGEREEDPAVRGAVVLALGRLHPGPPDSAAAALSGAAQGGGGAAREAIVPRMMAMVALAPPASPHSFDAVQPALHALRGFFLLARRPEVQGQLPPDVLEHLREWAEAGAEKTEESVLELARARRLALAALVASRQVEPADLVKGLEDPDPWVRREGALGTSEMPELVLQAMGDPHPTVRLVGVRRWDPTWTPAGCEPLVRAAQDDSPHVALEAISALERCQPGGPVVALLGKVLAQGPDTEDWHAPARALLSLATLEPSIARQALPRFLEAESPFVRSWGVQAAARLEDLPSLQLLAVDDPHPNVRTAALQGLLAGGWGEEEAVEALSADDPQLLLTAARGLTGTQRPEVVPAYLDALDRLSATQRETFRDPRLALLARLLEAARWAPDMAPDVISGVEPLLSDFDPAVAETAAQALEAWTGEVRTPSPRRLEGIPVPEPRELHALAQVVWTVEMESGLVFRLRLLPWEAPTNAARFARLVREGHFQGLTFHRVVPNFVIQGGSPAANEYMGDGPFTRDEIYHPHWRGTVGLSTRGRDTGDGQIFVNLVDNIRLDPDYTVFGVLLTDEDEVAAARVLEGDGIRAIREEGNLSPGI
ncbi:MAG: HEAT repeat domain-containing protein [Gemmatimonadota bacterium]